jgi:hypothetical protein
MAACHSARPRSSVVSTSSRFGYDDAVSRLPTVIFIGCFAPPLVVMTITPLDAREP